MAIRIHKNIANGTINSGAHFQRERVIHQDNKLRGLCECKTTVFTKRTAGTAMVCHGRAINFFQTIVGGQRAHRVISIRHFSGDRRFTGSHHYHSTAAALDIVDTHAQVVEESGTGTGCSTCTAYRTENIGIHKIGRHFTKTQRTLFGRNPFASKTRLHHAT